MLHRSLSTGLPELGYSSVAWGDYDNEGDLDLLLTGHEGRDDAGRLLSSGVYFVRMNTASRKESVKVLLAH